MHNFPILIVDDNSKSGRTITLTLENVGHPVFSVPTGADALKILKVGFPSMVLTDREMPNLDGLHLCRKIRNQVFAEYPYIVLYSSRGRKEDIAAGLSAGADQYLIKPIDQKELLATLNAAKRILNMQKSLLQKNESLNQLSMMDHLTGSFNRLYLDKQLPLEIKRCFALNQTACLILCDIDNFKSINDSYGYQVADFILIKTVALFRKIIREGKDWIVRYGGDELLILLPDTRPYEGYLAAERMRRFLSRQAFSIQGAPISIHMTASFGIVGIEPGLLSNFSTPQDLLQHLVESLHQAKREGGDRTRIFFRLNHSPDSQASTGFMRKARQILSEKRLNNPKERND
jgi:two-component system cell cycle response regulator